MNSFRRKIVAILLVSIMSVVGMATAITIYFSQPPNMDRLLESTCSHIIALADIVERLPAELKSKVPLEDKPGGTVASEEYTKSIRAELKAQDSSLDAVVRLMPNGEAVASVPVGSGKWLVVPFPTLSKHDRLFKVLIGWITLIAIGTAAVAVGFAYRISKPFAVLEESIASVGPDGLIPHVHELGTDEVKATARAINRLSERLKCAMESRMRLVAAAGHDLRTPMTRMWLRAEFLPEEDRSVWIHDLEELDRIADSAIRLVREEAGGGDREPVSFSGIVSQTCRELKETGLKVETGTIDDAMIIAGPMALKRALRNLVQNAATHGGGGHVSVISENSTVRMIVDDNGPGIPAETMNRIFEPFFRVDLGRRQTIPGAGLGLAIAKEIIERFSGSISIENRATGGLRQVVTFSLV
jgi:signal transduction histidine kinase